MLYQSRTYGSSYMGLIRLLILLGLIGVSVITKEGPRFKPFLADQVSLFLDSNLRDFNVLIDMPSLEPFASVDYILVYCEEKTNPIFTGPRFCVSEILTRKEPHQYIKLNPSEIIYNIALFARYRVGDKAVTTKPINTGSVNLTPCDESCWDLVAISFQRFCLISGLIWLTQFVFGNASSMEHIFHRKPLFFRKSASNYEEKMALISVLSFGPLETCKSTTTPKFSCWKPIILW
ncbi:uncharacterized protein LOC111271057 isoform X2 [Varroa jacobsoni]|uniref:uncharacterized protein LOC111271057 isoform X2 n=1 Tax=Varroa jacobsoni TaxID=62625 RepID=UPI000BF2CF6F|nr:uncharacterized protein LOC111271057 isoform X2 [Varroa jacobsoni]